ncbi:hypothetical protein AB0H34_33905 [Saccharopolyspora shandongensis]
MRVTRTDWRTASRTDLIRDFAKIVEEHGPLGNIVVGTDGKEELEPAR